MNRNGFNHRQIFNLNNFSFHRNSHFTNLNSLLLHLKRPFLHRSNLFLYEISPFLHQSTLFLNHLRYSLSLLLANKLILYLTVISWPQNLRIWLKHQTTTITLDNRQFEVTVIRSIPYELVRVDYHLVFGLKIHVEESAIPIVTKGFCLFIGF